MATTTAVSYASGTPTTSGTTWANLANATGAPNNARARWTSSTANATGHINVTGFAQDAGIPAGATIDQVQVTVTSYVNNTTVVSAASVQLLDGSTLIGSSQAMTRTTGSAARVHTFTGVTRAQIANLGVRVAGTHNSSTSSGILYVDSVGVTVTWSEAYAAAGSLSGGGAATATSAPTMTQAAAVSSSGTLTRAGAAGQRGRHGHGRVGLPLGCRLDR